MSEAPEPQNLDDALGKFSQYEWTSQFIIDSTIQKMKNDVSKMKDK